MTNLNVEDLLDEDMQQALIDARASVAKAAERPQHEKDLERQNLLRWLDDTPRERPVSG